MKSPQSLIFRHLPWLDKSIHTVYLHPLIPNIKLFQENNKHPTNPKQNIYTATVIFFLSISFKHQSVQVVFDRGCGCAQTWDSVRIRKFICRLRAVRRAVIGCVVTILGAYIRSLSCSSSYHVPRVTHSYLVRFILACSILSFVLIYTYTYETCPG